MAHILIQMDPLTQLNPATDTSLFLARTALEREHTVSYCTPQDISLITQKGLPSQLRIRAQRLTYTDTWQAGPPAIIDTATIECFLVRQEPPFDMAYITNTYMLEALAPHVVVQSPPAALRNYSEKLIPLALPQHVPDACITASLEEAQDFLSHKGPCIIKPLYLFGGRGIHKVTTPHDVQVLWSEVMTEGIPVIIQQYLSRITEEGDKRIFVLNGQVVGWFRRLSGATTFQTNLFLGGTAHVCDLTPAEQRVAEDVATFLTTQDIYFAGLDVASEKLLEVNITCPTGLVTHQKLTGSHLAHEYWAGLEPRFGAPISPTHLS